ncbi:hypothetical protein C8R46DRAFT_883383 [Mycena filopes]|nr:hypothetical protein C8R46DRAFT_883383 [Mycena filopes]
MDIDTTPTRVEELWFFDSGLVVQAEQSLYRVSGGVLAARSPIFKDMLSLTQPPDAETIEGCPVVRLPDSAADVTCFFRAIFDSSFFEPHPNKVHLEDVISILHLSNKYAVEYLLRRALVHLSSNYPTTLSEWRKRRTSISEVADDDFVSSIVASIQIAREVNALWVLPVVFYDAASNDEAILDQTLECATYGGRPAKLSDDDKMLFLKSSMQICRQGTVITRFLHSPSIIPGCQGGARCTFERLHVLSNSLSDNDDDPLNLIPFSRFTSVLGGCCQICHSFSKDAWKEAREEFFSKLPGFCGLPPWEGLEKMKADALDA